MKNYLGFFLLLLICCTQSNGQMQITKECGTVLKESAKARYTDIVTAARQMQQPQQRPQASYHYVRVFIHDFISDDGTDSSWSYNEIITEFNQASGFFMPYGICLVLMGIDYPRSTAFTENYNTVNLASLVAMGHSDALDVSLHKVVIDEGASLNGTAYDIPSKYLSLSRGALGNRSFAHEVGHCLGLSHTFETVFCLECPNGSNGTDCGDKISDTRATPDADSYMQTNTSVACVYTGNLSMSCDGSTQMYNPEIINMMSYGRRTCRSIFSPMQVTVMKLVLENIPGFENVWFDTPGFIVIGEPIGALIINTDKYIGGSPVQIGNNAPGFNVLMGGNNSQQKIISPTTIRITPGVKLLQPSDTRGRILLRIANYCQE